jgi:hypothetical protein
MIKFLWEAISNPRQFIMKCQFARLCREYPLRKIRPVMTFKRGKWRHRGAWRIGPPSKIERQIEEGMRQYWRWERGQ